MNKKLILLFSASLIMHFSFYASEEKKKTPTNNNPAVMVLPSVGNLTNPLAMLMLIPGGKAPLVNMAASNFDYNINKSLKEVIHSLSIGDSETKGDSRTSRTTNDPDHWSHQQAALDLSYTSDLLLSAVNVVIPSEKNPSDEILIDLIFEVTNEEYDKVVTEALSTIKADLSIMRLRTPEDGPWIAEQEVIEEVVAEEQPSTVKPRSREKRKKNN